MKGSGSLRSSVFHANAIKFSRERRFGFTDKYTENQNVNLRPF